jgi:hypothetical protein
MINFHKPTATSFTVGILFIGALAMSAPASAHGPGVHVPSAPAMSAAPSAGPSVKISPQQVPPGTMLSGSTTGRAVGSYYQPVSSTCSIYSRGHRRVQVCN